MGWAIFVNGSVKKMKKGRIIISGIVRFHSIKGEEIERREGAIKKITLHFYTSEFIK